MIFDFTLGGLVAAGLLVYYAYSSATGNNGSAFGGYTANAPYPNTTIGLAILLGRFLVILPVLAIAGNLASKKTVPASAGTFPTQPVPPMEAVE
jgi:potassium-transporting ATPase potassium-binding subunit